MKCEKKKDLEEVCKARLTFSGNNNLVIANSFTAQWKKFYPLEDVRKILVVKYDEVLDKTFVLITARRKRLLEWESLALQSGKLLGRIGSSFVFEWVDEEGFDDEVKIDGVL